MAVQAKRRASSNAPIDLERYAEITAHVRHFPADKKDEVVSRLGVRPPDWAAVRARWSKDIDASLDDGRADLVDRYSAAFARARRRLSSLRPTIESLGPLPPAEPAAPKALAAPVEAAPAEPLVPGEQRVDIPSYMSLPASMAEPLEESGPRKPSFMKPSAWSVAAAPSPPAAPEIARTGVLPIVPVAAPKMPFQPSKEESAEKVVQRAVAHANLVQGPAKDSNPLGATVDSLPIPKMALPFARPVRPIPSYTVERYASLKVELDEYAERGASVLARYQLDRDTFNALDDDWRVRMNADPLLKTKFIGACDRYRAWIRSRDSNKKT